MAAVNFPISGGSVRPAVVSIAPGMVAKAVIVHRADLVAQVNERDTACRHDDTVDKSNPADGKFHFWIAGE